MHVALPTGVVKCEAVTAIPIDVNGERHMHGLCFYRVLIGKKGTPILPIGESLTT